MDLTPSEAVLLAAEHFAPLGASGRAGAATAEFLSAFVSKRPDRALLGSIDESRLERTLLAAALLANEQQGILKLTADGIEVRAEPTGTAPSWPVETLEQNLLRGRALPVSQLVSDWRTGYAWPLGQIAEWAGQRRVLQQNRSQAGPLWIPAAAQTAFNADSAGKLLDDCRRQRPELWRALQSGIEAGLHRRAAAPNLRFEAGAMPDSIAVAELDERARIYQIPAGAKAVGSRGAALIWISILAFSALAPPLVSRINPDAAYTPPRLPFVLAFAVALATLIFDRGYRPAEPPPAPGASEEELALARERSLSSRHPSWRESLTNAATASGMICALGLILCSFPEPAAVLYAFIVAALLVVICQRMRLARLPSAREVELAVARRSRELAAAHASELNSAEVASLPPASAAGATVRPWIEMDARDLPPPTASAQARADQRRHAASFLLRRHWTVFALFVTGEALLTGLVWLLMGYDPWALLFAALVPAGSLVMAARSALNAWYRLRPAALQRDGSLVGRAMRYAARVLPLEGQGIIPDLGYQLRELLAAEPAFWRDEELNIDRPLGRAPAIGLVYWLMFVPVAFLLVPAFHGHGREGLAFTAAGLALAATYRIYNRSARAALARQLKVEPGVRLLMLRVFGSPSFDELISLIKPWLLLGPISHLEGYDSIIRSPEAREKLAEGRLDDVLIKTPEELARKLAAESAAVAADFRYRRYAFQCTDAVWKIAIRQMLDRSDVVVMDLSNLGPANLGCAYELGLLLDRVKLSQLLLLVSETTDRDCLRTILADAETRLSADSQNHGHPDEAWRLLRIGGPTAAGPEESYLDWVRRLDNRLDPMQLVSHLLDMALASPRAAPNQLQGL